MKYSIVIPTHNDYDTIQRCLASVERLEYSDYEVIISDTSDTEESWEYLQTMEHKIPKLHIYRNNPNWGMWENHNFVISKASGDFIFVLHTDDEILPDAFSKLDHHLNKLSYIKSLIIFGRSLYKDSKADLERKNISDQDIIAGSDAVKLFINCGITPSGTLYSNDFRDIGFLEDSLIPPHSDCLTMLYCAFKGYTFSMMDDIVFLRNTNGTDFKKLTKENREKMGQYIMEYFTEEQVMLLIKMSFIMRQYVFPKLLVKTQKYRKHILIKLCRAFVKDPRRFFQYMAIK